MSKKGSFMALCIQADASIIAEAKLAAPPVAPLHRAAPAAVDRIEIRITQKSVEPAAAPVKLMSTADRFRPLITALATPRRRSGMEAMYDRFEANAARGER